MHKSEMQKELHEERTKTTGRMSCMKSAQKRQEE